MLAGVAITLGAAAAVATGQLWLVRWSRVLDLAEAYNAGVPEWGNDSWPAHLVVLVWCSACAVIAATAAAGPLVRRTRWRYVLPATAALGALVPLRLVVGWASAASTVDPLPPFEAGAAVLLGALLGTTAATALLTWRGVGRSVLIWAGWIWLNVAGTVLTYTPHRPGRDYTVPVQPFGVFLWGWSPYNEARTLLALLPAVMLAALLGWWAKRRGERATLLGAIAGPLLLVAAHLAVPSLLVGTNDGSGDELSAGLGMWIMAMLLGLGAAVLSIRAATVARPAVHHETPAVVTVTTPLPGGTTATPRHEDHPRPDHSTVDGGPALLDPVGTTAVGLAVRRSAAQEPAPAAVRRILGGAAVAGTLAAGVGSVQLWLARWARVLVPDQTYDAGNDTWPFQLVLLVWCAASATVIGAAVAEPVVRRRPWRRLVTVAAALGSLVPLRPATGWAAAAAAVGADVQAAVVTALLLGAMLGAAVATAVLTWRGIGASAMAWLGLVWLSVTAEVVMYESSRPGRDHVVPAHPLGLVTPTWFGDNSLGNLVALLPPIVLAAVLGWWATRKGYRPAVLGAVIGPLLLAATHLVARWLPGGRNDGDHYSLSADLSVWLLLSVLTLVAARLGVMFAQRVRVGPAALRA